MDPAHNQRDIFDQNFTEKPKAVSETLMIKEVDTDFWIEKYLKETTTQIKETYKYESAFNLQNYFNLIQNANKYQIKNHPVWVLELLKNTLIFSSI